MSILATLTIMLTLGVSTGGCAIFLRALPWPERWKERKPLACPACMSGWSGFCAIGLAWDAGLLGGWRWSLLTLAWGVCIGIGSALFAFVNPPAITLPEAEADLPSEAQSE